MSPNKETNFFAFEGQEVSFHGPGDEEISRSAITTLKAYRQQFGGVSKEIAIGEASPWYLYSARTAENIHRHVPDAKLIAVLRNPVDRAFSSYLHVVRDGRERLTFEKGILAEEERIAQGWEFIWHYQRAGFYAAQVERYMSLFSRDQLRFYLYDDLLADTRRFLRDIYEFLGVDTSFVVDTSLRPNSTGVPKNRLLGRLILQPNHLKTTAKLFIPQQARYNLSQRLSQRLLHKPSLSAETHRKLTNAYKDDISALQDLIGRDLSAWTR
jgi:hypothetical protein